MAAYGMSVKDITESSCVAELMRLYQELINRKGMFSVKEKSKPIEYLYHYTSFEHLQDIIETKQIKLCPSNLLRPIRPHIKNNSLVDMTDSYKPVVWFTSELYRFDELQKIINNGLSQKKAQAVICVPTNLFGFVYKKWDEWAVENGIEKKWFEILKKTAPNWRTFYVSERPVPITDDVEIMVNPIFLNDHQ